MNTDNSKHTADNPTARTSLPSYQFGNLEISLEYNSTVSSVYLLAVFKQRDSRTLAVIDRRDIICRALPIDSSNWNRKIYVREICEMIAAKLSTNEPSLEKVDAAMRAMCHSWNILGVFLALEKCAKDEDIALTPAPKAGRFEASRRELDLIYAGLDTLATGKKNRTAEFTRLEIEILLEKIQAFREIAQ